MAFIKNKIKDKHCSMLCISIGCTTAPPGPVFVVCRFFVRQTPFISCHDEMKMHRNIRFKTHWSACSLISCHSGLPRHLCRQLLSLYYQVSLFPES